MDCRLLRESEYGRWDALVHDSPDGTLFHSTTWREAFKREYEVFGLVEKDRLRAGAIIAPGRRFGIKIGRSGPLTPYGGVALASQAGKHETRLSNRKHLIGELATGLKQKYVGLVMSLSPSVQDVQPFIWENYKVDVRYTYEANVRNLEDAWDRMASQRRGDVRKARDKGFEVIRPGQVETLLRLVEATFDRKDSEAEFLSDLERVYREPKLEDRRTILVAVDDEGRSLAAAGIVWDDTRAYYLAGGFDPSIGQSEASSLLLWQAMRMTAEEQQLENFDFEGSMVPGVESYFRKFGGRLIPRFNVKWSPIHRFCA